MVFNLSIYCYTINQPYRIQYNTTAVTASVTMCPSLLATQVSCLVKPWLLASIEIGFSLTAELLQSPLNLLEGMNVQDFFCHLYLQEKKKKIIE